ncbi:MAG: TlyA family RNA methyltransferase [Candidatus Aminicenantia bacterium]
MKKEHSSSEKDRADKVLFISGFAESREKAELMIREGLVYIRGRRIEKPSEKIFINEEIFIKERIPFVSRGGLKLDHALKLFNIDPEGKICLDIGTSTGGFADVFLQRGVRKIYCVDVNFLHLHPRIKSDPRVLLIEKNAKYLEKEDIKDKIDIASIDVSFISILKILPSLKEISPKIILALGKPQFEAGRGRVKKGVVRDVSVLKETLLKLGKGIENLRFNIWGMCESPVKGEKGNREFFFLLKLERGEPFRWKEFIEEIK